MEEIQAVVGALAGAAVGFAGAYAVGRWIRERASWVYWTLNAVVLVIGVAAGYWGLTSGGMWAFYAAVAFLGGAFSGMKYGYERVLAPWKIAKVGDEERRER